MALMKFREPNQVRWQGVRPGHNGTQISKSNSISDGDALLHSVTAGLVFYLCNLTVSINTTAAGSVGVYIYTDVPLLWKRIWWADVLANSCFSLCVPYWPPFEVPSLYDVKLISSAANVMIKATLFGWEE